MELKDGKISTGKKYLSFVYSLWLTNLLFQIVWFTWTKSTHTPLVPHTLQIPHTPTTVILTWGLPHGPTYPIPHIPLKPFMPVGTSIWKWNWHPYIQRNLYTHDLIHLYIPTRLTPETSLTPSNPIFKNPHIPVPNMSLYPHNPRQTSFPSHPFWNNYALKSWSSNIRITRIEDRLRQHGPVVKISTLCILLVRLCVWKKSHNALCKL